MGNSWPPPGRLVGKLNTAGQTVLTVDANTPAGAGYGGWYELSASLAADSFIVGASLAGISGPSLGPTAVLLDVGIGAVSSEVALATLAFGAPAGTPASWMGAAAPLPIPVRIAASQRVAVRVGPIVTGPGTVSVYQVNVWVVPYASIEGN